MAFQFATEKLEYAVNRQTLVDMMESYEQAFQAKLELEEVTGGLEELDRIWDNINSSIESLALYGDGAIRVLNVDKSLEDLLGVDSSKIDAKLASSALEDASQSLWDKFKDYCERLWTAICNLFKAIFGVKGEVARCDQVEAALAKIDDKTLAEVEFPSAEKREVAEEEAKNAEEAAKIFLEVDGYATELAAIAAAISFENDSRVDELNAKIKELENKVTVCEGKLDKIEGKTSDGTTHKSTSSSSEGGKEKMGVLGWTKATLLSWVKTFKKFYIDYCQKAIAAAERARSKSKSTADKLDSLQKAGKTKPKDEKTSKVNGTIKEAKSCHNKINNVARRSSAKVAKHKQKSSARMAALQKNAAKWSDGYDTDGIDFET